MKYIAVPAREWRERLQELIDMALEQGTILVYLRRSQPAFFVIPQPLSASLAQQHLEYTRLLEMYLRVTDQAGKKPIPEPYETLPYLPVNSLRRDLNKTLMTLKTEGVPFLLKRYNDVLGFVVPVPVGTGGMSMIKNLAIWHASADGRNENGDE